MRKVKLSLDTLHVESFATAESRPELRGTVDAHMPKPTPPLVETYYAGDTCECTFAMSCIQTNCGRECLLLTIETCP